MWRQETALHPSFAILNQCLSEDWFLLPFELSLQSAHAKALEAGGLLSKKESGAIETALADIKRQFAGRECPTSDAEDLHTWIETELTKRTGDAGKKIHTGRSRNDQVATLLKLYVISSGERLRGDLHALVSECCRRAEGWADVPMVMHTHQQYAAPGSAGFWILRFAVSWDRARRHVGHYLTEWRRSCPLGSGAVAGSSLPVDRNVQARELGFKGPSLNALESTSCRDECLEFLGVAAQTALHLQALAADVIIFTQTGLGWVKYPKEFGTGSSMMPNKMNPDAMELLRGEANAILAAQMHATMLLKGLPSGYDRDLQCVKPLVRDAAEKLHVLCEMTAAFLAAMEFDAEKTRASMAQGAIGATLLMEKKVAEGKPLREAHHEVAELVSGGLAGQKIAPEEWIKSYKTAGSANPEEVRRAAREIMGQL
jgi:argininosuccinate lyase